MSTWLRPGLGTRLYVVAVLLGALLGGTVVVAWHNLGAVGDLADRTGDERVPQLGRIASVELDVTRVSLQLRHAMLVRTPEALDATLADIADRRRRIGTELQAYRSALRGDAELRGFDAIAPLIERFWAAGDGNVALIRDGRSADAFAFLVERTIPARNALLAALDEAVKAQQQSLGGELAQLKHDARTTLNVLVVMVLCAMAGLLLSSGRIGSTLRRRIAESRAVAERVRDGDLTMPVRVDNRDEFSPLLAALGEMQAGLARIVVDVRTNAEALALASTEIAHGNQDLSQRTETQASALEQTAATMDQLAATVHNNADSARQANELALGASSVAERGGLVVGRVVESMKGISESSTRIGEIIAVIDAIAFQTNILALNAAVEAARAGEQGRGFAVVAAEVRTLAQRSADAAREIHTLVDDSVKHVAQGRALVGEAGQTMQEIVPAIARVRDIVGEISTSSAQQSASVVQVSAAVSQMDQVTQQNAGLVEEIAAGADGLKQQAEHLVAAVAVFKVRDAAVARS